MQNLFVNVFKLLQEQGIRFSKEDFVVWCFTGFDKDVLADLILENLPFRYIKPEDVDPKKVYRDWKEIVASSFVLSKKFNVKYPFEFFRKITFRGKVTVQVYSDLVSDISHVMRNTFEQKVREFVLTVPTEYELEHAHVNLKQDKLEELEERFQTSTLETDFERHLIECVSRYDYISKGGPSFQVSLPPSVFEALKELEVKVECFGNPLAINLESFCSPFEEDKVFGSMGSFFNNTFEKGRYQIHITFSNVFARKVKERIQQMMDTVPMITFYVFLPKEVYERVGFSECSKKSRVVAEPILIDHQGNSFKSRYPYVVAILTNKVAHSSHLQKIINAWN